LALPSGESQQSAPCQISFHDGASILFSWLDLSNHKLAEALTMNEHKNWQRTTAIIHFERAESHLPRSVRVAAAASYVGASISDVEAWLKGTEVFK
jgi:hypothetical protein